jgi:hypothetical protein
MDKWFAFSRLHAISIRKFREIRRQFLPTLPRHRAIQGNVRIFRKIFQTIFLNDKCQILNGKFSIRAIRVIRG